MGKVAVGLFVLLTGCALEMQVRKPAPRTQTSVAQGYEGEKEYVSGKVNEEQKPPYKRKEVRQDVIRSLTKREKGELKADICGPVAKQAPVQAPAKPAEPTTAPQGQPSAGPPLK